MGKDMRDFWMYKIRTMTADAELKKKPLLNKNEADGPVFKIRNDPRYTKIGKLLSHTGIDELPQLINIMKGEMAFVGPRPLPVDEAQQIPHKYHKRFTVLPGITSLWVLKGAHYLTFKEWMELDIYYIQNKSLRDDVQICIRTGYLMIKMIFRKIFPLRLNDTIR